MKKKHREFINTLIWSSCRYFVGRHTIAAAMHAPELAEYINENKGLMDDLGRKRLAADIRQEINDNIRFSINVNVSGKGNVDAFTLISEAIIKHLAETGEHIGLEDWRAEPKDGIFNAGHWIYNVDLTNKTCTMEYSRPDAYGPHSIMEWLDLVPWIKLAGWLDPNEVIWYKDENGVEAGHPGFSYPTIGIYQDEKFHHIKLNHCPVEPYIKKPYIDTFIREDAIIRIEPIGMKS